MKVSVSLHFYSASFVLAVICSPRDVILYIYVFHKKKSIAVLSTRKHSLLLIDFCKVPPSHMTGGQDTEVQMCQELRADLLTTKPVHVCLIVL